MRRAAVLLPLLLLALAPAALAKLDAAEWTKVEKQAKEHFAQAGESDAKMEIVRTLAKDGEPRAYRILGDALLLEAAHVPKVAKAHEDLLNQIQPLLAKSLKEMRQAEMDELQRLQLEAKGLERAKSQEAQVLDLVVETLALGPADARKAVFGKTKSHAEWTMRAACARLAAASPEDPISKPVLTDLLEKEKDGRVRLAALETLGRAKGTGWQALIVGRIGDPDWTVQVLAIRLSAQREIGRAIPVLIETLARADARVGEEIASALRKLTGQNFEAVAEVWTKWWEANRSKFGADGRPVEPLGSAPPNKRDVEFYGIKAKTDRVVFIVDMSGSMKLEMDPLPATPPGAPVTGPQQPPADGKPQKIKIDVARRELKRALDTLPRTAIFNIIAFNHNVVQWQPHMSPATPDAKAKAYEWFAAMEPAGSTFIDGALQMAFKLAGIGAFDKAYAPAIDTIILLTDGAPTDNGHPDAQNMDPEEILKHVREWNANHLVKIHCVGIDRVHGIEFLKKLAKENDGTYVDG